MKNIFQIINNHNKEIIKDFQDWTNNNNNNNGIKKTNVIVKLETVVQWMDFVT